MSPPIPAILEKFLLQNNLLNPSQPGHFLVAYSGGKDSTALLHALWKLKTTKYPKLQLTAAYYWHGWRSGEHDIEAIHKVCAPKGIPWTVLTPNLNAPKTEAAARDERYEQLGRLAISLNSRAILTAHHQDDQLETILFRLVRGSGLSGLKGIRGVREHQIDDRSVVVARPLLTVSGLDLLRYVKINKDSYYDDPTNTENSFARNFLRNEIVPRLDEQFPQFRSALLSIAEHTQQLTALADMTIEHHWKSLHNSDTNTLDYSRLLQVTPEIREAILLRFLAHNNIKTNPNRMKQVIGFIDGRNRKGQPASILSVEKDRFLSIYRGAVGLESPDTQKMTPISVTPPCALCVPELNISIHIKEIPLEERPKGINYKDLPRNEAYVNLSQYKDKALTLRVREDGDRITPLGMTEPIKLKRLLNNRGISRFKRDQIPLLTIHKTVLWAIGVELSELIKVKSSPTHHIRIEPLTERTENRPVETNGGVGNDTDAT